MHLVKNHIKTILLCLIWFCGCTPQSDFDWVVKNRGQAKSIKVYSYDEELQDKQLKYEDMSFWLTDYVN